MPDESQFEMVPVASSQIAAVGYSSSTRKLRVEFVNGSLYEYDFVPEEIYTQLVGAPSVGSFFHDAVRNSYPYSRIG